MVAIDRRGALVLAAAAVPRPELAYALPASLSSQPTAYSSALALNDGTRLPLACFGVQIYDDETARARVATALEAGFRSFFASIESGNQVGVARALADSAVPRGELYIGGSILSDAAVGYRSAYRETRRGVERNLENMAVGSGGRIGQLDQLLLEYPAAGRDSVVGQWRALEDAQAAGLVRTIGVSNFSPRQLDFLLADTRTNVVPALNQLPYSLAFRQPYATIRDEHLRRGIALQAWSPLGGPSQLISQGALRELAAIGAELQPRRTAYQVGLRWILQSGVGVSLHSSRLDHLREDLEALHFELGPAQMRRLDAIAESVVDLV